jgi:peroxiredoxin
VPGPGLFSFKLFSETDRGVVSKNESETQFNDLAVRNTFLIHRKVNSAKVYLKVRSRPHTEQAFADLTECGKDRIEAVATTCRDM